MLTVGIAQGVVTVNMAKSLTIRKSEDYNLQVSIKGDICPKAWQRVANLSAMMTSR